MSEQALWYRDAVVYQLRVRSFCDSNDDGIGDFPGLTSKLDYLRRLGVTAVWLLPFYPSPMRDDGYDIADYTAIHPQVGSLGDFRRFLREAHRRDLRVITELVMNHTSDQHPWFQRARRAPAGSRERDFYVWSDDATRYEEARIIFKDFELSNWAWDPVARSHYWHRFYSHQPDLNFDNPLVQREMFRALDFWFRMGVDGVRLDAIPYLFERDGTSCENLPETHAFLRALRKHVDAHFPDRMLLAEANQWPEDAVAYFGDGNECHMAFHFPIMPRLFMALHMETRDPILDILSQTPAIAPTCQWAVFLRNHDELTLEMVTDEERDYMLRAYAPDVRARINLGIRHRLAPLLRNDRRRLELMITLLLSMPGTPILYYGDEIGMGDNIYLSDRDAVRTPMQWSPDRNAGFSRANPQKLILPLVADPEYSPDAVNVEVQERNESSLLWFTRRILALRSQHPAFGRGSFEPLHAANRAVLAFLRRYQDECVLVVANLSRHPQHAELDLRELDGQVPVELFGRRAFPAVGELPYLVTLGPHGSYWFEIRPRDAFEVGRTTAQEPRKLPELRVEGVWSDVVRGEACRRLERALVDYLPRQRWFRSKALEIRSVAIVDAIPLGDALLTLLRVSYAAGEPEEYAMPMRFRAMGDGELERALAQLQVVGVEATLEGYVVEAADDADFYSRLFDIIARGRRRRGRHGRMVGVAALALRQRGRALEVAAPTPLAVEQTNTSWRHGDQFIGKLFRRVEPGPSRDLVLSAHLSERVHFPNVPQLAGHLELHREGQPASTIAVLHAWAPNEGDAWDLAIRQIEEILDAAGSRSVESSVTTVRADEQLATAAELAALLGQRTGELHAALGAATDDPAMAPELFNPFARRSYAQAVRNLAVRNLELLQSRLESLPDNAVRELARELVARRTEIEGRTRDVADITDGGRLIHCHGDYHLGQVLYTGNDFVILDFEGEPARSLAERRRKRSPLSDVAGMLRSFHYAAEFALRGESGGEELPAEELAVLEPWVRRWHAATRDAFLGGYYGAVPPGGALLPERPDAERLLAVHVLEKALYEVGYELNNRPQWLPIPLRGLHDVLAHWAGS